MGKHLEERFFIGLMITATAIAPITMKYTIYLDESESSVPGIAVVVKVHVLFMYPAGKRVPSFDSAPSPTVTV